VARKKNDPILDKVVKKLKAELQLSKLFLFGSRSSQSAGQDSDYDLLAIVSESDLSRFRREINARLALKDIPAAIDIFVFTESEFSKSCKEPGSIAEIASVEGLEIPIGNV
jgi:predicted nucleotidyltransferase